MCSGLGGAEAEGVGSDETQADDDCQEVGLETEELGAHPVGSGFHVGSGHGIEGSGPRYVEGSGAGSV